MKVLLVGELSWSYVVGSSTKKVQNKIFDELKKKQCDVHFFEISPKDSLIKKLLTKIIINKNNLMTGGLLRLWIKISNGEYDIVHLLILRNYQNI